MSDNLKKIGQAGFLPLVGIGVTIAIASVGGFFFQTRYTDAQMVELKEKDSVMAQRISTLEEAVATIKSDNKDIKTDVKEILRLLR